MDTPPGAEAIRQDEFAGQFFRGLGSEPKPGVVVLHGAGGGRGYEQRYASMLAAHGYAVLCVEYFGTPLTRDALVEVPLEEFKTAANWLLGHDAVTGDTVGFVGFSRGGELALLVGSHFDVAGVIVAYVPGSHVWVAPSWMDGVGRGQPSWTLDGEPLPFLDIDEYVTSADDIEGPFGEPPNPATLTIERARDDAKERSRIPVEAIDGPVLVLSGEKDRIWPSARFGEIIVRQLEANDHPWRFEHRRFREAGHVIRVPYTLPEDDDAAEIHPYGGTHEANAHAAASAWEATLSYLGERQ